MRITDMNAPEMAVYRTLTENELKHYYEPDGGLFIAESPNVILRALDAGYEPVSLLLEEGQREKEEVRRILERSKEIPVYEAPAASLRQLTGYPMTRGALCAMRRIELPSPEELCRDARRVAVLEEVMNPTNLGAIFRSAAAMGMDAVLLTPGCSDPLFRRAARVSMGTVFQVPWAWLPRLTQPELQDKLSLPGYFRNLGFCTAAMALTDDSVPIDDPRPAAEKKLAVILGTEGDGLSARTISDSDYTVKIPMSHGVDSLNVAAAAAVAFWVLGKGSK
ncbi:MAG: RNA methyltransferase [Stomatobaculum sp.]|nr:RNA methyltransferase [Stomatobaculum sp.]